MDDGNSSTPKQANLSRESALILRAIIKLLDRAEYLADLRERQKYARRRKREAAA